MKLKEKDATLRIERRGITLRELTLEKLRSAIENMQFEPGERLIERKLGENLGVSKTVVREALRQLESEGMIKMQPYLGPVVAVASSADVAEIFEIRESLEVSAVQAAAERVDDEGRRMLERALTQIESAANMTDYRAILETSAQFYEKLFGIAEKHISWGVVKRIQARINSLRYVSMKSEGRLDIGMSELRRMVDAINAGDTQAAEKACREHIRNSYRIVRSLVSVSHEPDETAHAALD